MRPSSNTGTKILTAMMMPPIVGTPIFFSPNGSMLRSRAVSEILCRFMYLMKRSPNHAEISSERISVSNERNEMYIHMREPGMSYCSKKRNR